MVLAMRPSMPGRFRYWARTVIVYEAGTASALRELPDISVAPHEKWLHYSEYALLAKSESYSKLLAVHTCC